MLRPGEKVYDDSNWRELIGDGTTVMSGGVPRMLSRIQPPAGIDTSGYSRPFSDLGIKIPRNEWSARIKEQVERKRRVSDWQTFKAHDQGSYPTCWANGPAHAMTTQRVMQGLPLVYISAMSVAVPISGGHSGGWEHEALKYFNEHGGVSVDLWSNTDTSRSHMSDPKCEEDRQYHKALEWFECETFDDYATAALLGMGCAVAYNFWSHVLMLCDLVEIEPGSFGVRDRNNWGESYGDKNESGFGGYVVFREGKGTPDSGFALRQVTSSPR